jgi:hypothetical protein
MIETGWECTHVTGPPYVSTCTTICGDGKNMNTEVCDDGVLDGKGCKDDCTGEINGNYCTGGTTTTAMTCSILCGDNFIIAPE